MADLLRSDRDLAPSFLNSVLNQLNWAFSEFIGMIQEVGVCAPGLWDAALNGGCVLHTERLKAQLTGLGVTLLLGRSSFLSCLHCLADPAGSRAPGEELCGQPPAEGVCHLL